MLRTFRTIRGVARSLRIYYRGKDRRAAMDDFYRQFVQPGDLVFDVGAHVGDRVGAFRRLGARVVAVEPQPALVTTLRLLYGRDRNVTIEPVAVGSREGSLDMKVNVDNPTVSTASTDFIQSARGAPGWETQVWSETISVPVTTLDALVARHGMPSFIKIDVEGYEDEALAGLSRAPKALSFEFTTIQRALALACLDRCAALGYARFNAVLGESLSFAFEQPRKNDDMARWIAALSADANSGDVYALQ